MSFLQSKSRNSATKSLSGSPEAVALKNGKGGGKKMSKLIIIKDTTSRKPDIEIWRDANDILSVSPNSKQESRMRTPEELKTMGRPHIWHGLNLVRIPLKKIQMI